ncbi:MAG: SDR family oxidoreductase [Planctomycetota bacterium]|jgi:NADP-dependent 3-hydroxy acid dehydrogenase YdfG
MTESSASKTAIVVGASSGMGCATAASLARNGWRVLATARRVDRLEALRDELQADGFALDIVACDVCDRQQVEVLVAAAIETLGQIDLLVYATGTNIPDRSLEKLTPDTWQMMLDTNLSGAFLCTTTVLPAMRASGGGQIIYLSTAAVQMPDVSGVAYQASKHGLTGLAHGTRVEEKQNGIRTTIIFPGLCETEILTKRPVETPREILDQALQPQDVADAVLFVASLPPRAVVPEMQLLPATL